MVDKKVSELTATVTPAGTDEFPVNQSGTSKKTTLAQIKTYATADLGTAAAADTGDFATAAHNHDASYATAAHNHDASYSATGHNHDASYEASGAVATHEADTTNVHGITDTSALLTTTAADAAYQPLDADLTAIAAVSTTSYGRGLLALADQAALQSEVETRYIIRADADRSLTNANTEQALFNDPSNGRLTLTTGAYFFEALFYITGMSATSGNAAFDPLGAGTATIGTVLYHLGGIDNSTPTNAGTQTGSFTITQQTVASAVTAGTGTAMGASIRGTFEITGAGTLIPSITLVTASAATLRAGSYFRCERIGSTSLVSIGPWD